MFFLQETHAKGKLGSSGLIKVYLSSTKGLAAEVFKLLFVELTGEVPEWVNAWIKAEGQRPWPKALPPKLFKTNSIPMGK